MRRAALLASVVGLAVVVDAARAAELTPELAARIQHEQRQALDALRKPGGTIRAPASASERTEQLRQEREAAARVLEKHGVKDKDLARYVARMPAADRNRFRQVEAELRRTGGGVQPGAGDEELPIQRGFDEDNPPEHPAEAAPQDSDGGVVSEPGAPSAPPPPRPGR